MRQCKLLQREWV